MTEPLTDVRAHPLDDLVETLKAAVARGGLPARGSVNVWSTGNDDCVLMVGRDDPASATVRVRILGPKADPASRATRFALPWPATRMCMDFVLGDEDFASVFDRVASSLVAAWDVECERLLREGSAPP